MSENRVKVILHRRDGWGEGYKLSLTRDQVRLMEWISEHDLIDNDTYDLQVLEEQERWQEI